MKKVLLIMMVAVMAVSMPVIAQQPTMTEWHDLQVNEVNRYAVHTSFPQANRLSLDGTWRFLWVEHADQRPTDFFRMDYDAKNWVDMPVPHCPFRLCHL